MTYEIKLDKEFSAMLVYNLLYRHDFSLLLEQIKTLKFWFPKCVLDAIDLQYGKNSKYFKYYSDFFYRYIIGDNLYQNMELTRIFNDYITLKVLYKKINDDDSIVIERARFEEYFKNRYDMSIDEYVNINTFEETEDLIINMFIQYLNKFNINTTFYREIFYEEI